MRKSLSEEVLWEIDWSGWKPGAGGQMKPISANGQAAVRYEIRVRSRLSSDWAGWFDEMTIQPAGQTETILSGNLVDQAALHGLLAKIRDLNLVLVSINSAGEEVTGCDDGKGIFENGNRDDAC